MIQMQTVLEVADNSGAKQVRCLKVLGGTKKRFAGLGDTVVCSVIKALPGSQFAAPRAKRKKDTIVKGVIVRCKKQTSREDGSYVSFDSNAVVLIDVDRNPRGTRIFGAVARELRERRFMKIISLASEVV
ncbi:MAG: 50S ribosomal protein L14 [Planctomycetaceae bacterium]